MKRKTQDQPTLFDLPKPQEKYRKRGWFYITRRGETQMLCGLDQHGNAIWLDHDLERHLPHIINNLNTAKIVSNAVGGTKIHRCWYTRVAGHEVRF